MPSQAVPKACRSRPQSFRLDHRNSPGAVCQHAAAPHRHLARYLRRCRHRLPCRTRGLHAQPDQLAVLRSVLQAPGAAVQRGLLVALAALVLLLGTRRLFSPVIKRTTRDVHPSYLARLSVASWSTMIPTIAAGTFAATCYFLLMTFNVLRPISRPSCASSRHQRRPAVHLDDFDRRSGARPSTWRLVRVSDRGAVLLLRPFSRWPSSIRAD